MAWMRTTCATILAAATAVCAAAALSIDADCAVQDLEYARLREVLLSGGQVIAAE